MARLVLVVLAALSFAGGAAPQSPSGLPPAEQLAPGISYYKLDAPAHLGPDAPISARLLEIRTRDARLDLELGKDGKQGRDTVASMAARRGALAAVNAGFFATNGDPAGIFKIDGLLVSDTQRPRGAVGFGSPQGPPVLFGRVTARAHVRVYGTKKGEHVRIDGVDTVRGDGDIVLYTRRYGATTGARGEGTEWVFTSFPPRVSEIRRNMPPAPVPDRGWVLSQQGAPSPAFTRLRRGTLMEVAFEYSAPFGSRRADWYRADDIVGGAGLLLWRGKAAHDWKEERLDLKGFVEARHPRTLIGVDAEGDVWLVVVDGRQPGHSVGMSLPELTELARRIGLVDALNLDGGGSSTMVVKGEVVNRPSDPTGPRPVSDAIVVLKR